MEIAKQRGLVQEILLGKFYLALLAFHRKQYDLADRYLLELLVDELESHTQSADLRQEFLNARRLWQEDGYLP